MVELSSARPIDALAVKLGVDGVCSDLARMEMTPESREAVVVGPAAQSARSVARSEGGCLVEEEELGELPWLEQSSSLPAAELELTRDPALHAVAPAYPTRRVVQTAAISVHETASGIGDEIAERCDAVLERHDRDASDRASVLVGGQGARDPSMRTSGPQAFVGLAVVAAVGLSLASPAARGMDATSQWLTLRQAKRAVGTNPAHLIYCEVSRTGDDACPVGWTPLVLDIRSARVRGYGASRVLGGKRRWREFYVSASCGSDRFTRRQFNAVFLWSYQLERRATETTSPTDPGLAGVAHLGCKSPPSDP